MTAPGVTPPECGVSVGNADAESVHDRVQACNVRFSTERAINMPLIEARTMQPISTSVALPDRIAGVHVCQTNCALGVAFLHLVAYSILQCSASLKED